MDFDADLLRRQLAIDDPSCVEIESKWRLPHGSAKALRRRLSELPGVEALKRVVFFDQFLDTPELDLLKIGASLRLRYRKNGEKVYLQYKGPGFTREGVHLRSEFSSHRLDSLVLHAAPDALMRFSEPAVQDLLGKCPPDMRSAMSFHLGAATLSRVSEAVLLCQYQKDSFRVEAGEATMHPSVDRLCVFRLRGPAPLAMSTIREYENQLDARRLEHKLAALPALRAFDAALAAEFELTREPFDKYRRCASGLLAAREKPKPPIALARN